MTGLAAQIEQANVAQTNAMAQFNVQQENANNALRFQTEADFEKTRVALKTDLDKYNAQLAFNRNQWNTQNAQAVEQSNIAWRRQSNTINTAAANQVAMQNAMNAANLNSQALSFLWQELRDQADFDFRKYENEENRRVSIITTALANEGESAETYSDALQDLVEGLDLQTLFG